MSHILSWQGSEGGQPRPMATVEDLNLAIVSGSNDQLKEVLNSGIDPDAADVFGNTPLKSIIEQSGGVPASQGQVETLLAAGADPNLPDEYGDTPLHAAAYQAPEALMGVRLEAGGNPNLPNEDDMPTGNFFLGAVIGLLLGVSAFSQPSPIQIPAISDQEPADRQSAVIRGQVFSANRLTGAIPESFTSLTLEH